MPVTFGEGIEVERGNRTSWADDAKKRAQVDEVIDSFLEAFGNDPAGTSKRVNGFKMIGGLPTDTKSSEATQLARRFNDRIAKRELGDKVHAGTRKDVLHLIVGPKPVRGLGRRSAARLLRDLRQAAATPENAAGSGEDASEGDGQE